MRLTPWLLGLWLLCGCGSNPPATPEPDGEARIVHRNLKLPQRLEQLVGADGQTLGWAQRQRVFEVRAGETLRRAVERLLVSFRHELGQWRAGDGTHSYDWLIQRNFSVRAGTLGEALGTLLQPFGLSPTINGLDRTVDVGPVKAFGNATADRRLP